MGADVMMSARARELVVGADGEYATARVSPEGDALEVRYVTDDGGEALVVRIDPRRRQLELRAPGDLRLAAPHGRVSITSSEDVVVEAERTVRTRAGSIETEAGALHTHAKSARWTVGRWEVHADRMREAARQVVREVEGTLEERAARVRVKARELVQILSEGRTSVRSKDNTSIDGKRVLLG